MDLILFSLLLIIFIQQLFVYINKIKPTVLCCGLWCFVGKEKPDPWKMKILALYNQVRGDHSTGICIDDEIIKQLIPAKDFVAKENEIFNLLAFDLNNNTVLGHCRQATAWYSKDNLDFAHPHKTSLNGKDFLRLIHNGSLRNTSDLVEKYKTTMVNKSDSMLLGEIISNQWNDQKLDILREYEGSATLVFYPVGKKNTLFVHRDKERELYYWMENEGSCYISSIKESLMAIGAFPQDIIEFTPGILYKFYNGKITKQWDFTEKKPYLTPRVVSLPISRYTKKNEKVIGTNGRPNGIIWDNHLIYSNGHLYTGNLYISKDNKEKKKFVSSQEKNDYDMYYLIMGMFIKDKKSYEEFFQLNTTAGQLDPEKFKKLLPSQKQKYALYPILGKTFKAQQDLFFWSDDHEKLKTIEELYSWTPALSGKTFSVNRAGFLISAVDNYDNDKDDSEIIRKLIDDKLVKKEQYHNIYELLNVFRVEKKASAYELESFMDHFIKMLKDSDRFSNSEITQLEDSRLEDYKGGGDFITDINTILRHFQNILIWTESEGSVLEEEASDAPSSAWYASEDFLNEVLFGDYETLDDLLINYIQFDDEEEKKPLFMSVLKLFRRLDMITASEYEEYNTKNITSSHRTIARLYEDLRKEKCITTISDILSNGVNQDSFRKLYERFTVLELKNHLTVKEHLESEILRFGLVYMMNTNGINKAQLQNEYGVGLKELQTCR